MSGYRPENPLIVQSDQTVLVEVASPRYAEARDALARFAELVKSPEHVHTYRITPLSIWNAAAAGEPATAMLAALDEYAKYPVPEHVRVQIRDFAGRYGRLRLLRAEDALVLETADAPLAEEIAHSRTVASLLGARLGPRAFRINCGHRSSPAHQDRARDGRGRRAGPKNPASQAS